MKVSLNWIREFTTVDLDKDELLARINAQLGAVDEIIDLSEQYQGIVIAKVIACDKHPNADKLKVCTIDDGNAVGGIDRDKNGHVQVVCGAPNVAAGMLVAWLPPGVTVPATFADMEPLVLDKREIRGVISNGMLASPKELAFSDNHNGILEIDLKAKPGDDFSLVYKLDDLIIDLENKMFTHRPDCFGILGVAREFAGIQGIQFTSPDWYKTDMTVPTDSGLSVALDNQIPELVPRMTLIALDGITIKPSPSLMQSFLSRVGLKPINNVVDITNFIAHLTAQPLHAFDYDKIAAKSSGDGAKIVLRKPKKGETLALLDGQTITPHKDAVLVCTDQEAVALAGVMGGQETEVDDQTTRVLLEAANFDMYSVRRSSMEHGLFTEASTRLNKGQSIYQLQPVIAHALSLFASNTGGQPASEFVDSAPDYGRYEAPTVDITADFVNQRLGRVSLEAAHIRSLLEHVEFEVEGSDTLTVKAPFWRTDIHIPEDIVEEVGRLYGYDTIPLSLPQRSISPAHLEGLLGFKQTIRTILAAAGANELLTYSFVSKKLMTLAGQDSEQAYELRNALSPELNYYRMAITPSLLEVVHANHRTQHDQFVLFELNRVHNKTETEKGLPIERDVLSLVFSADKKAAASYGGAAYYQAKRHLQIVIDGLGLSTEFIRLDQAPALPNAWLKNLSQLFVPQRSAVIMYGDQIGGIVGEYTAGLAQALKVPNFAAGFEIDLSIAAGQLSAAAYQPLSRYPSVNLDVTYQCQADQPHTALETCLRKAISTDEISAIVQPTDSFQAEADGPKRHTWHVLLASYERTLTAEDAQKVLTAADAAMAEQFSAARI